MYLLFSRSQSEAYGLPRGLFVIIVHRLATPPNSIPPTVSYLQVLPAIPVMVTLPSPQGFTATDIGRGRPRSVKRANSRLNINCRADSWQATARSNQRSAVTPSKFAWHSLAPQLRISFSITSACDVHRTPVFPIPCPGPALDFCYR
jgi:hypothetical protein